MNLMDIAGGFMENRAQAQGRYILRDKEKWWTISFLTCSSIKLYRITMQDYYDQNHQVRLGRRSSTFLKMLEQAKYC